MKSIKSLGLKEVESSPTLVVFRNNGLDYSIYSAGLNETSNIAKDSIKKWIMMNREPLVYSLDENTQNFLNKSPQLVVLIMV